MLTDEIFSNKQPDPDKLRAYGFSERDGAFFLTRDILDGEFSVRIRVAPAGVKAETVERETGETYSLHLVENAQGTFVSRVREAYIALLEDIRAQCFGGFHEDLARAVEEYVRRTYGCALEFLWSDLPDAAVWRRADNRKWFSAIMRIKRAKLGIAGRAGEREVEVLDVRIAPEALDALVDEETYFRGYHMNKKHWLTVMLDGSVPLEEVCARIDESYALAAKK